MALRAVPALLLGLLLLTQAPEASANETIHTVSKGQTLGKIAKRYRTTVDAIREVNQIEPKQRIHPGLVLVIPEKGKEAEAAKKAAQLRKDAERKKTSASQTATKSNEKETEARNKKSASADQKASDNHFARKPKRAGFVQLVRNTERLEIQLLTRHGKLIPKALPSLSRLLRASPSAAIPIDPRLAVLIGLVSDHFGGRTIHVVSGYRPYSPTQYTPHSNHNFGRAMDFMVEGVPNAVVRDYCRTFRNAGVGYYPNSTFVHMDVRSGKTYWVDYSKPGEPPRYDHASGPILPDEAARDVGPWSGDGSKKTSTTPKQPIENIEGNQNTPDVSQEMSNPQSTIRPPQLPTPPYPDSTPTPAQIPALK